MTDAKNITHKWYDTWILCSVLLCGRSGEYASLDKIIAAADFINHAIPTSGELDGALSRLLENGWIEQSSLLFAPSESADAMFSERLGRRTTLDKNLKFIEASIGAEQWSSRDSLPVNPGVFVVAGLNEYVIQEAYRKYKA